MIKTIVSIILPGLAVFLIFCGCAGHEAPRVKEEIVIPGAPEEPRLHFLHSYRGSSDFDQSSALDILIGEPAEELIRNMNKPYGVGAKNGKIYATDTALGVVFVFDTNKRKVTFLGDKPSGKLASPISIAFDSKGLVYVSDAKLKRVYAYDENASVVKMFGADNNFYRPTGIAINSNLGLLYVVDTLQHHISVFTLGGELVQTIGKRGIEDGEFNYPTNIAIDRRNGNVIVGDTQNFRIQIFDKDGRFLGKFGQIGDKPGMFARPKGVAVDSEGNIYAADAAFNNIQIFNDKGDLLLYFGGGGTDDGRFNLPSGLYFDEEDRLYTTEGFNARVQVFQYLSSEWKREHHEEYKRLKKPLHP